MIIHVPKKVCAKTFDICTNFRNPLLFCIGIYSVKYAFYFAFLFFFLVIRDQENLGKWRYVLISLIVLVSVFSDWAVGTNIYHYVCSVEAG